MENINSYIDSNLISVRKHPTKDLYIFNYTHSCAFSKHWDEVTLMCRGLIKDSNNNIIARPFKKFFNFGELEIDKKYVYEIPKYILEKVDGSLGILFYYDCEWDIATRGSFESEQAITARSWLNKFNLNFLNKNLTYLVEIVYPENKIVVNYSEEDSGLYMLGAINTVSGLEEEIDKLFKTTKLAGFKIPKKYEFSSITDIVSWMKNEPISNSEGYVVTFNDGTKIKVKYEQYCILHKIVTGLNSHKIWESISENCEDELISMIPDEYYEYTSNIIKDLKEKYNSILETVINDWSELLKMNFSSRKEWAVSILTKKYPSLLFNKLDNKNFERNIWKLIEPKNENTTKNKIS